MLQSGDCNGNRTHNHLVPKRTLNHLANPTTIKLKKKLKNYQKLHLIYICIYRYMWIYI